MNDYTAEGWFISNGGKLSPDDLEFFKSHLLRYGTLVTETLYQKDKFDQPWVLKAGEPFEDQGRIVVVLRESEDMLRIVCERHLDNPMMVGQHEIIGKAQYQVLKAMTSGQRLRADY